MQPLQGKAPFSCPGLRVWCLSVDEEMGLEQIRETFLEVTGELWVSVLCSPLSSFGGFMSKAHLGGVGGEHSMSEYHCGKFSDHSTSLCSCIFKVETCPSRSTHLGVLL